VAIKTPQFYLLSAEFFTICAGGIALFSMAKPLMSEVFTSQLPQLVTSNFASNYVMMLSLGNLLGRFGWAIFSDKFGRKLTF
jgi:hypothetical protein